MRTGHARAALAALSIGILLCSFGGAVWGIDAVILTSSGHLVEGSVSGIASVIRLADPESITYVVPGAQYDVSLDSIRQITLDFPRVVIETADRVLVGPYSAFLGISELLRVDRPGDAVELPTASIRAIALHGNLLRPVPREWLGDGFLDRPEILAATPLGVLSSTEAVESFVPVLGQEEDEPDLTPIWNGAAPAIPPAESDSAIPWWVGLLAVAALIVIIYLATGQGSS